MLRSMLMSSSICWCSDTKMERKTERFWVGGKTQKMKFWTSLKTAEIWNPASCQCHPAPPRSPGNHGLSEAWSWLSAVSCVVPATWKLCYSDGGHLTALLTGFAVASLLGFYPPKWAVLQWKYRGSLLENCCLSGDISGRQRNQEPPFKVGMDHQNGWRLNYYLCSFQVR